MKKALFMIAAMGCVGITTEIFFTAILNNVIAVQNGDPISWRLMGQSYIWMFPIYGIAGVAFPWMLKYIGKYPAVVRMVIYALGIFAVEFVSGWALDMITGSCPWEYKSGWHIMGYIQLEYFPLWAMFGFIVERICVLLGRIDL